jgi:hypothetical protein
LPSRGRPPPAGVTEEVIRSDGEEVVRVHEAVARGDDAVPVEVGIVAEGDVVAVAQLDEPGHGVRRRAVHPDLSVGIERHEGEGGVDGAVHHVDLEAVAVSDGVPVREPGAAHRVGADAQTGRFGDPSMSMTEPRSAT